MSNEKETKKRNWGGKRDGAGKKPREGGTKKICVSVTKQIWEDAISRWDKPSSQLIDLLLKRFVADEVSL